MAGAPQWRTEAGRTQPRNVSRVAVPTRWFAALKRKYADLLPFGAGQDDLRPREDKGVG